MPFVGGAKESHFRFRLLYFLVAVLLVCCVEQRDVLIAPLFQETVYSLISHRCLAAWKRTLQFVCNFLSAFNGFLSLPVIARLIPLRLSLGS